MRAAIIVEKKEPSHISVTRALLKAVTVAVLVAATVTVVYLAR